MRQQRNNGGREKLQDGTSFEGRNKQEDLCLDSGVTPCWWDWLWRLLSLFQPVVALLLVVVVVIPRHLVHWVRRAIILVSLAAWLPAVRLLWLLWSRKSHRPIRDAAQARISL